MHGTTKINYSNRAISVFSMNNLHTGDKSDMQRV